MRKYFYAVVISLLAFLSSVGQVMHVVTEHLSTHNFQTTSTNGDVILTNAGQDHLLKYNDVLLLRYNFPSFLGVRLRASDLPLASFRSSTYVVLRFGEFNVLHRFDGASFSGISIPGSIVAGPIVFGDNLYVLARRGSLIRLYRYNGATVTEIPSTNLPVSGLYYELRVAGNYLYLIGRTDEIIKRYDGTTVYTFPHFDFSVIDQILPIGETGRAYFRVNDTDILYFNGSSISTVFDGVAGNGSAVVFGNDVYFLYTFPGGPGPFHRISGSTATTIPLPPGYIVQSNLVVYNDAIFMQVNDGPGTSRIVRYDGAAFSDFFLFPEPVHIGNIGVLFLRDDHLIILPELQNDRFAYEFDGSTFTTIEGTVDRWLTGYVNSTDCNHLWLMSYIDQTVDPTNLLTSIVREPKGCLPTLRYPVMPRRFFEFESFNGVFAARAEKESWSDMIFNWDFDPVCDVPQGCQEPAFLITLSDEQDKIAWQQKIDKPGFLSIPVDGKVPLKTSLAHSGKSLEQVVLMDENIIKQGITGIGFSINYKEESFILTARTKPGVIVYLVLTLHNQDGKEIWRKELKAPFITNIKDKVSEPGVTLHFSVVPTREEIQTKADNTSFSYLNPSHGSLMIDLKDMEIDKEADVMITTILGQKILSKKINATGQIRLSLPEYKPGLFVISIKTKDGKMANKIVWLK